MKHKPTKFETAMQSFQGFLKDENEKNAEISNSFHQQLLTLESKRLEFEREERERERQHEMMMMQMFGNMIKQSGQPAQSERNSPVHKPVLTDLTSYKFSPPRLDMYSLYDYK